MLKYNLRLILKASPDLNGIFWFIKASPNFFRTQKKKKKPSEIFFSRVFWTLKPVKRQNAKKFMNALQFDLAKNIYVACVWLKDYLELLSIFLHIYVWIAKYFQLIRKPGKSVRVLKWLFKKSFSLQAVELHSLGTISRWRL